MFTKLPSFLELPGYLSYLGNLGITRLLGNYQVISQITSLFPRITRFLQITRLFHQLPRLFPRITRLCDELPTSGGYLDTYPKTTYGQFYKNPGTLQEKGILVPERTLRPVPYLVVRATTHP